jgi:hypothetical protein
LTAATTTTAWCAACCQQFSADAIQEYKVTTQRYSAEYGRSVGGVVNVITKSGSNDFHGSAFVFARNQSLNSKTYFEEQANAEKPDFRPAAVRRHAGRPDPEGQGALLRVLRAQPAQRLRAGQHAGRAA